MKIGKALEEVNRIIASRLESRSTVLKGLFGDSSPACGKQLRARLFFDFRETVDDRAVKAASAIELLHTATLIHDDILDESVTRRDRPALYIKCGIPASVLYGDYLVSEAFSLMVDAGDPLLLAEMVRALSGTLGGEIEEQSRRGDLSMTRKEYLAIIERKSGSLFGFACMAGLIMKGLGGRMPGKAYRFGMGVGTAYQILDDLSDYFGPEGGRKKFNDFREGVITLPLIYLLDRCSGAEKKFIAERLRNSAGAAADPDRIITLMKRYEVISDCCDDARDILRTTSDGLKEMSGKLHKSRFGVAAFMEEKIDYAEKEYRNSRKRICGNERNSPAGQIPECALQ